jgi:hypothetical protein
MKFAKAHAAGDVRRPVIRLIPLMVSHQAQKGRERPYRAAPLDSRMMVRLLGHRLHGPTEWSASMSIDIARVDRSDGLVKKYLRFRRRT